MSTGKKSIKISKHKQRDFAVEPRAMPDAGLKPENQIRRELIRTVTSRIEERKGTKKELVWPSAA